MINQLDVSATRPETADLMRRIRDAQWWANLAFAQHAWPGPPINVYQQADGLITLSVGPGTGTLLASIWANPSHMSGQREEWREAWMQMGDRRY